MSVFSQIGAVVGLTFATIPQRWASSLTTVLSVALVVATLLAFLSIGSGFAKTLEGSGRDDVAIAIRSGAGTELNSGVSRDQQRLLEQAAGVAVNAAGTPLVSPELLLIVDATKRGSGTEANIPLRGMSEIGLKLRDGFVLSKGRMFEPGTNEIIVGAGVEREFTGFELDREIRFGTNTWRVVGIFEIPGTVFESEVWADLGTVQNLFDRGSTVQTVRAALTSPDAIEAFKTYVEDDPRIQLDVTTEKAFYAQQGGSVRALVVFGWVLAVTLSLGALAGALNTMYAAVAARTRELATLRAIGFGGFPAFVGAILESLVLAGLGGLVGALAAYVIFDGLSASTLGEGFTQVVFSFSITPEQVVSGVVLALIVGLIGGFLPAIRAANTPILQLGAE